MFRQHNMRFGAEVREDGSVRLRLWAPALPELALVLHDVRGEQVLPMARTHDGWFEIVTEGVRAGDRYGFLLEDGLRVPDPASRFQPEDVHGLSEVIDPRAYTWRDGAWRGRPWEEAVLYELHVGAFTPAGTFRAAIERLDYLAALGVTAIELMPVADFPGRRNWGYDGVYPFAPDSRYGRPEDLKALVEAAHARGLMLLLDVVYNHFGPEGNYLHRFAPQFFTERHRTPWGAAINFDGPEARPVRDFFIHNALYWLEEYHVDGLRLDAVHAIGDDSEPDILVELATAVRGGPGRERHVHLVLENDRNQARYLERAADGGAPLYDAQWNDDVHHACHVLLTGESDGYYSDYAERPSWYLGRCLAEGYAQQGELSGYRDHARGEPSAHLPPSAFVSFLQTHDQVGNRAFGERLVALADEAALRAATVAWLLAPSPPLLFMGEEYGAGTPFLYFCDFAGELAAAVTEGRRREFARFARFADAAARIAIPDPNDAGTFGRSRLDWSCIDREPHARWLALYGELLALRRARIVPRLARMGGRAGRFEVLAGSAIAVFWRLGDGSRLELLLNLGSDAVAVGNPPSGTLLRCEARGAEAAIASGRLPPRSAAVYLAAGDA